MNGIESILFLIIISVGSFIAGGECMLYIIKRKIAKQS